MPSNDSTTDGAGQGKPGLLNQQLDLRSLLKQMTPRRMLVAAVVVFVAIQFVPVDRDNPPIETEAPLPPQVRAVLYRSCGDCHTNETVWPWYSRVAPVSWMIAHDVHDGRRHMNFSTWNRYDADQQERARKRCWQYVQRNQMPPWFYKPMHQDIALSEEDKAILKAWSTGAAP